MKKILLLTVTLLNVLLLSAQGVYQLWGMTTMGGTNNNGIIFKLSPGTNQFIKKFDFSTPGGGEPRGGLSFVNGKFYGMTSAGSINNGGIIFEWNPYTDTFIKRFDFVGTTGRGPYGGTLTPYNNLLYGMTYTGGANDQGVIFEWNSATNTYTNKVDLGFQNGGYPFGSLTVSGDKLYGVTNSAGSYGAGVIFEWDPVFSVYIKKIDLVAFSGSGPVGNLIQYGKKFYGMTIGGGYNNKGVIFEWDPSTNLYTNKFDFDGVSGRSPIGSLTLRENKFYGVTSGGGVNDAGVIFEWNPDLNVFFKKFDFNGKNGNHPIGSLTFTNGKFYGMTYMGGSCDAGVIFEWNPVSNEYHNIKNFTGIDGKNPNMGNYLALAPAPVCKGLPNTCTTYPSITINSSNNNEWVAITDEEGNAVAEIKANGNNLGTVTASMFVNNGAVREDGTGRLYLDRSITMTSQFPQKTAVDIRLYVKGTEYTALKNAHGINSINDIGIFKIKGGCVPAATTISNLINTNGAAWENDFVLSASINSFTSFYFASKNPCAAPVITAISATPSSISPADHKMKNATVNYSAKGNCFPITTWLTVTSNEAVSGTGNGDLSPDWIIIDDHHVQLRSERSGSGAGRTYTITINAKNAFGTYCKKIIKVMVPSQPAGLAKAIDGSNGNGLFDCKVIPNPTSNYFNLQIESASNEKIEMNLLDISGRLISKWNTVKDKTFRFGENLKPGVYIVEVKQDEHQQMIKIIKQ
jgi:uncharacterized repeat protein (TIGR03803 family)